MTRTPFSEWLMSTKPGPQRRCTGCDTYSLRTHEEKVICTNPACHESPLHRNE